MKTKYVLHGGSAQHENAENDRFFSEILSGVVDNPRILLVEFAGSEERFEKNVQLDRSQFLRIGGNRKLSFEVAEYSMFVEQVRRSDVVYIGGGTTNKLLEALRKFPGLNSIFMGKTVAGESAGANVQASYCYSKSAGGVIKCLGWLPVKMWPHYEGQDADELDNTGEKLELVLLPNYKYRIYETG